MGQRHHLVPRFYLERWAVPGRALKAIRRSTGEVLVRRAKTVAFETDAYAIESPIEGKSYVVEEALSALESEAAIALRNMLSSWPPSQKDKESWSLLMAFQLTRGAAFRDNQNTIAEYMLKTQMALDSREPAVMHQRLEAAGLEPTDENLELLREMMDEPDSYRMALRPAYLLKHAFEIAFEALRYLVLREWSLVHIDLPLFVTCDHPLSLHSRSQNLGPFGSVGLMTADEIWMPLDPRVVLVMTHPDTEPRVGTVPIEEVPGLNARIALECDEWVVAHPDNPHVGELAAMLKGRPSPRMEIGGPTPSEWAEAGRRMARQRSDPQEVGK